MFDAEKASYNKTLAAVREDLATLVALRGSIEAKDAQTKGKSKGHLEAALKAAFTARTFNGYEGDLSADENPFRAARRAARRA